MATNQDNTNLLQNFLSLRAKEAIDAVLQSGKLYGPAATAELLTEDENTLKHFADQLTVLSQHINEAPTSNSVVNLIKLFAVEHEKALQVLSQIGKIRALFVGHNRVEIMEAQLTGTIRTNEKNPKVLRVLANFPTEFEAKLIGNTSRTAISTGMFDVKCNTTTSIAPVKSDKDVLQTTSAPFVAEPLLLNNQAVQRVVGLAQHRSVADFQPAFQPSLPLKILNGALVFSENSNIAQHVCTKWVPGCGVWIHKSEDRFFNTSIVARALTSDIGSAIVDHQVGLHWVAWVAGHVTLIWQGAPPVHMLRYGSSAGLDYAVSYAVSTYLPQQSRNYITCLSVSVPHLISGAVATWPAGPVAIPLTVARAVNSELQCATGGFEEGHLGLSLVGIDLSAVALTAAAYKAGLAASLGGFGLGMAGLSFIILVDSSARMGLSTPNAQGFVNNHKQHIDQTVIGAGIGGAFGILASAARTMHAVKAPGLTTTIGMPTFFLVAGALGGLGLSYVPAGSYRRAYDKSGELANTVKLTVSNTGRALWDKAQSYAANAQDFGGAFSNSSSEFVSNMTLTISVHGRALLNNITLYTAGNGTWVNALFNASIYAHNSSAMVVYANKLPHYFLSSPVLPKGDTRAATINVEPRKPVLQGSRSLVSIVVPPAPSLTEGDSIKSNLPLLPIDEDAHTTGSNTPSEPGGRAKGKKRGKKGPQPAPAPAEQEQLFNRLLDERGMHTFVTNIKGVLGEGTPIVQSTGKAETVPYSPGILSYIQERDRIIGGIRTILGAMHDSETGMPVINRQAIRLGLDQNTADQIRASLARIRTGTGQRLVTDQPGVAQCLAELKKAEDALKTHVSPVAQASVSQKPTSLRLSIAGVGYLGISVMVNWDIGKLYAYTMFGPVVNRVVDPRASQTVQLWTKPVIKWFNDTSVASTKCINLGPLGTDCINVAWGGSFVVLAGVARPMLNGGFIPFVATYAVSNELSKLGHRLQPKQSEPTLRECAASIALSGGSGILSSTLVHVGLGWGRLGFGGPTAFGMGITNAAATTLECYYGAKASEEHRSLPYIVGGVVTAIALIGLRVASLRVASTAISADAPLATGPGFFASAAMFVSKAAIVMVPAQSAYHITDLAVTVSEPAREFSNKIDLNYALGGFAGSLAGGAVGSLIALAVTGPIGALGLGASLFAGAVVGTSGVAFADHMGWIEHHQHDVAPVGVASAHDGMTTQAA